MSGDIVLMPCPFCGASPSTADNPFAGVGVAASQETDEHGEYIEEGRTWSVMCCKCGSSCGCCASEADAISDWNRRAPADEIERMRGLLEEAALIVQRGFEEWHKADSLRDMLEDITANIRAFGETGR